MKNLFKETLVCVIMITCITMFIVSCSPSRGGDKTKQLVQEESLSAAQIRENNVYNDQYIYADKNGVIHSRIDCEAFRSSIYDKHQNDKYSVSYILRRSIDDWDKYASTHQFCVECFSPELLDSIKYHSFGGTPSGF